MDSTIAIQLDKKYIKAYQRRALARTALGQLKEAKSDYEEILQIEPKNALALLEKSKIEKKLVQDEESLKAKAKAPSFNPKNIFDSKKKEQSKVKLEEIKKSSLPVSKSEPSFKVSDMENAEKAENKVHREGNKKVLIEEIVEEKNEVKVKERQKIFKTELTDGCKLVLPVKKPPHKRSKVRKK